MSGSMNDLISNIIESRRKSFELQFKCQENSGKRTKKSFQQSLLELKGSNHGIIAEIKRHSPGSGISFIKNEDVTGDDEVKRRVKAYNAANVQAISIITEPRYFKGGYLDLLTAVKYSDVPVLCKDFVVLQEQVEVARHAGASSILIIARIKQSMALIDSCFTAGLEPFIEIHDEEDLNKVIPLFNEHHELKVIGINNRDLSTLAINFKRFKNLTRKIKDKIGEDIVIVSESGIRSRKDMDYLLSLGADAFLIGSAFMKAPLNALPSLISSFQERRRI
ncbi:MAG: indole-3-glycerol-phosphate synthase [Promethearchaeota archaeon]